MFIDPRIFKINMLINLVALKWSSEPPSEITINYGERIDMKCSADSNPTPEIEWFRIGKDSSSSEITFLLFS
jgi:hypothetical protein